MNQFEEEGARTMTEEMQREADEARIAELEETIKDLECQDKLRCLGIKLKKERIAELEALLQSALGQLGHRHAEMMTSISLKNTVRDIRAALNKEPKP